MTVLRGGKRLATKIKIAFFVGIDVLNIFHLTTFSKKSIFSRITVKNDFGRHDHFWGNGVLDVTNIYNLSFGKWVPNTVFKFFSSKTPIPLDLKSKNWFCGHIFPHICGFSGPIVSKNNIVHPWADPHQPCKFHENRFKITTYIVTSYTYIHTYTSSPGKLQTSFCPKIYPWQKIRYNVTKDVGRVYSVSKSSASCSKVCGNNYPRRSVQSGHMVAEHGVKPLCYHLFSEMRCTSFAYSICKHIAMLTHYFLDILCKYIKHLIPANLPANVMNKWSISEFNWWSGSDEFWSDFHEIHLVGAGPLMIEPYSFWKQSA